MWRPPKRVYQTRIPYGGIPHLPLTHYWYSISHRTKTLGKHGEGNWLNNSGWLESAEISPQNPIHFFPLWTFQFFSFAASLYHWHISSTITHYLLVSLICLRFYSPPIKFTHFVLVPAQFIFPHGWECATAIQYVILSHKNRGNKWQWTHRLLCLLSFLTLSKETLCHHVELKQMNTQTYGFGRFSTRLP